MSSCTHKSRKSDPDPGTILDIRWILKKTKIFVIDPGVECGVWIVRGGVKYRTRGRTTRARNAGTLENDARDSQYPPSDNKDRRGSPRVIFRDF